MSHGANPENAGESGLSGDDASKWPAAYPQDLQAIIDVWPSLPEAIRAGIVAMVKATGQA
jgi:hypothetical protein